MISAFCLAATKAVTGAQARWKGCDPENRQRVYFANHSSNLDLPAIWSSLPRELRVKTRPVAAADYWQHSALRRYLAQEVFRALLIERKGSGRLAAFNAMLGALDEGSSLIIFPEGTRTQGHSVTDFKSGLYFLARERPDIQFIPTYLENLNRVLPKGEKLLVPILCSITFGTPLSVNSGEGKAEFLHRAKSELESLKV